MVMCRHTSSGLSQCGCSEPVLSPRILSMHHATPCRAATHKQADCTYWATRASSTRGQAQTWYLLKRLPSVAQHLAAVEVVFDLQSSSGEDWELLAI